MSTAGVFYGRVAPKDRATVATAPYDELDDDGEGKAEDGEEDEERTADNPGAPGAFGEGFGIVVELDTFVFHCVELASERVIGDSEAIVVDGKKYFEGWACGRYN